MGRERDAAKWERWRRRLRDFERGQKSPSGARLSIPGQDHAALRIVVAALLCERGEDRPC